MSRCYADPVEVLRRNDEPAHFLWRSRLYVVRGVLGHWVETGDWWHSGRPEDDSAAGGEVPGQRVGKRGAGERGAGRHGARGPERATQDGEPRGGALAAAHSTGSGRRRRTVAKPASGGTDGAALGGPIGGSPAGEEREVWRVEASMGRCGTPGVYELSFAWSSGAWTLSEAEAEE
jgi:hypothetical protein